MMPKLGRPAFQNSIIPKFYNSGDLWGMYCTFPDGSHFYSSASESATIFSIFKSLFREITEFRISRNARSLGPADDRRICCAIPV